jgi:thiosulfate reductase cytochrome b subunit
MKRSLMMRIKTNKPLRIAFGAVLLGILLIGLAFGSQPAQAQSPLHPTFPFLDKDGLNVLESGAPVSTMQTCGQCHDTVFIESHSFHAQVGLDEMTDAGETASQRPWDTSPGLFGRWNPITYGADLTTTEWLQQLGARHVGGGPATEAGIEMNCFLCHLTEPNNQARIEMIQAGEFAWANTATLLGTGIVEQSGSEWVWNSQAFTADGELSPAFVTIQDPSNENCGQCHGLVHTDTEPFSLGPCGAEAWSTLTTGQVISDQRITDSGLNLADKDTLTRSWDIHAERLVSCTDCHFSLNNPVYSQGNGEDSLDNLQFDPRRIEIGEYLKQPVHQFARGQSAQVTVSPELKDTMRRCEGCHDPAANHDWLPYQERHMEALNCESCHIPQLYAPAVEQVDWTVVSLAGTANTTCRGTQSGTGTATDLVTGYTPVLMQRQNLDGDVKLTPYNLVASWFWVYGEPGQPVSQEDLASVWLDSGAYAADVVAEFDKNGDGELDQTELTLDTSEKEAFIAARIEALGLANPRILAEVQPYSINHNVSAGDWAIQDCETCHDEDSRITQPIKLADHVPGGVMPEFVKDSNTLNHGEMAVGEDGALYFYPFPAEEGLYVFGHDNVSWVDWFGAIFFGLVFMGVVGHGGLRVWAAKKNGLQHPKTKRVYMYTFYERLWHWLQTIAILILIFTGLVIHKPEMFGMFSFRGVVQVHNILAFLLVANAALALFYNLVSGDIKRFIPQPQGFFNQAIEQVIFYTKGIFTDEEHPFEKTREKRLNPLQKITYFGILNVLLPLQVITGLLMWGVQRWPKIANALGGLPFLAPFHTLIAWLFASFIVAHVYLTTTGHTPMAGIKSMITGWDDVEVHTKPAEDI